ncbi:hypothetical protein BZA77DRAFT_293571 [Pyronema omphalodes]|nr:hypothetical protein BZA77DRAFT_293571 [Pyronema omphalodes]
MARTFLYLFTIFFAVIALATSTTAQLPDSVAIPSESCTWSRCGVQRRWQWLAEKMSKSDAISSGRHLASEFKHDGIKITQNAHHGPEWEVAASSCPFMRQARKMGIL